MFVGHYGVSFAVKRLEPRIPLWTLFIAVQLLDVLWAPFVLVGLEKVKIVPGITASSPLDLHYMPYTHSLVGALIWSAAVGLAYLGLARHPAARRAALLVGLAVFSHWVLDLVVHRPDLPLWDDTAKVGLGLWNYRAAAFVLEGLVLFGGIWYFVKDRPAARTAMLWFGVVLLAIQAVNLVGPPPPSAPAVATIALSAYLVFAVASARLEYRRVMLPSP